MFPDFTLLASEDSNFTHLHHWLSKIFCKGRSMGRSLKDDISFSLSIIEKGSIGLEKPSSFSYKSEVIFVEGLEASRVHLHQCGGVSRLAFLLQIYNVVLIHWWVSVTFASEIVEAVGESIAMRCPNGVSSCMIKKSPTYINLTKQTKKLTKKFSLTNKGY